MKFDSLDDVGPAVEDAMNKQVDLTGLNSIQLAKDLALQFGIPVPACLGSPRTQWGETDAREMAVFTRGLCDTLVPALNGFIDRLHELADKMEQHAAEMSNEE